MAVRILIGDVRERLRELPDESVHCVVTSPPYWGLRAYQGDPGMIGLEPTFDAHLVNLVAVFKEVRRVLRADGTLWLNYGDAYSTGNSGCGWDSVPGVHTMRTEKTPPVAGFKSKNLLMMPARVAMALQADGWWLRSEIVWHKPNPMPESVTDRPTSAHEKLFLLSRRKSYYYDAEAVRVGPQGRLAGIIPGRPVAPSGKGVDENDNRQTFVRTRTSEEQAAMGSNLRNVWTIATHAYSAAHFATFPPALVEPCIKAGTSEKGVCGECGAPWGREVERDLSGAATKMSVERAPMDKPAISAYLQTHRERAGMSKGDVDAAIGTSTLCSWFEGRPAGIEVPTVAQWGKLKAALSLDDEFDEMISATIEVERTDADGSRGDGVRSYSKAWNAMHSNQRMARDLPSTKRPWSPLSCLDPFAGAGTVGLVADRLQRDAILIEISSEYAEMARKRIEGDAPMFSDVSCA